MDLDLKKYSWDEWQNHVLQIPYGRISDKTQAELVLKENIGTCSSKHILLHKIGTKLEEPNLKLWIGIFKMNADFNSKLSSVLTNYNLDYIPEAHCFITQNSTLIDCTSPTVNSNYIQENIIQKFEVTSDKVIREKSEIHKNFIKGWIEENKLNTNLESVWEAREKCIAILSA